MLARIRTEPALILALVGSLIALVVSFGFKLSPEQIGGIMAAVSAILGVVTRSQVTPVTPPAVG